MLGALIGAGASLIGGIMGNRAQDKANQRNEALQREFAKNSIQWKAEDARKAGIHPVYAMGAPTYSPSPSHVGETSLSGAVASMGQDIGRSIDATRTAPQKADAFTRTAQALELERASLVNQGLRADLAVKAASTMSVPPFPSATDPYLLPGQSSSGLVRKTPMERIASAHGALHSEPSHVSSVGWEVDDRGTLYPVPSKDLKDRTEDSPYEIEHWIRNRLGPFIRYHKGMEGRRWNPFTGGYERR